MYGGELKLFILMEILNWNRKIEVHNETGTTIHKYQFKKIIKNNKYVLSNLK